MTLPKIVIISSIIIGIILAILIYSQFAVQATHFSLNGQSIQLELALSPQAQYQGLSDRQSLCADCGMLFIFSNTASRTFVMRRMYFPLDIVWIKKNKVVGISSKLPPEREEPYQPYSSPEVVDMVLEINSGQAEKYSLQVGKDFNLVKK